MFLRTGQGEGVATCCTVPSADQVSPPRPPQRPQSRPEATWGWTPAPIQTWPCPLSLRPGLAVSSELDALTHPDSGTLWLRPLALPLKICLNLFKMGPRAQNSFSPFMWQICPGPWGGAGWRLARGGGQCSRCGAWTALLNLSPPSC